MESQWKHKIFAVNEQNFESLALEIFRFQYSNSPVYRDYVNALSVNVSGINSIAGIPFLPIRFFKSHTIRATAFEPEAVFESSGTTGSTGSRHFIKDIDLYRESFTRGFMSFYGPAKDWCILGLLPSYLERGNSSLVYMVNELIRLSGHPQSGFYLHEYDQLISVLMSLEKAKQKTLLFGVTFALLDLAEKYRLPLEYTTIVETGGMKGRREEMIRKELHEILRHSFGPAAIHSEYGMTELLSQAWSKGDGIFRCPPWMKIIIRDEEDPLSIFGSSLNTRTGYVNGAINIIDLANIYSCSFIASDDAGRLYVDGSFEVLGRIDNSDLRGCSLMVL
ncbi:MAG: acyl transferase [Bacteroidota bacterium]|nr:acyl transferase [Bacteroidota bacterium]